MADLKELVKKNKKRALAFAITTAFSVGIATTLTGCENYYDEEEEFINPVCFRNFFRNNF